MADQAIRTLRRNVDRLSADVDAGRATITQLTGAREELVAQLAARDAEYARFVASFRAQVETIAETEEGRALLAQRRPGNLAQIRALLDQLADRRVAAIHQRANIEIAAVRRSNAVLALDDRNRGEATTQEVIESYVEVTGHDPSVASDWLVLAMLYREAGQLERGRLAAERGLSIGGRESAALYIEMGLILVEQGRLSDARTAFQTSADIASQRFAQSGSPNDEREYAHALMQIGVLLRGSADLAGARPYLEQSLEIARRYAEANPGLAIAHHDVWLSTDGLGFVIVEQGDTAGTAAGLAWFEQARASLEQLVRANPDSVLLRRDLGQCLGRIGHLLNAQGHYSLAQRRHAEALEVRQHLAAADPTSVNLQLEVSDSLAAMAHALYFQGQRDEARRYDEQSLAILERLAATGLSTVRVQGALSLTLGVFGSWALEVGDLETALRHYQARYAISARLAAMDVTNARARRDQWMSMRTLVEVFPEAGHTWRDMLSLMEAAERLGTLWPADRDLLAHVRERAAREREERAQ